MSTWECWLCHYPAKRHNGAGVCAVKGCPCNYRVIKGFEPRDYSIARKPQPYATVVVEETDRPAPALDPDEEEF